MDLMVLAADERADLADFLDGLDAPDWEAPSLCPGWRVRDVAAHVVSYDGLGLAGTVGRFLQGRLSVDRINAIGVREAAHLAPAQLVQRIRDHRRPSGLTAGFRGGIGLTDGVIHHQDIRRALGRPRSVPAERLLAALPFALKAPTIDGRRNARGLELVAVDLDWRSGRGPEVRGPAEALLMAVTGRPAALDELSGDGADTLRRRIS